MIKALYKIVEVLKLIASRMTVAEDVVSAVKVYTSSTQTIATHTDTVINMDTEIYDKNNEWDSSTYTFTAKKAGVYIVTLYLMYSSMNDQNVFGGAFKTNGVKYPDTKTRAAATGGDNGHVSIEIIDLDIGGTVQFLTFHLSGSDKTLRNTRDYCVGSIVKVA